MNSDNMSAPLLTVLIVLVLVGLLAMVFMRHHDPKAKMPEKIVIQEPTTAVPVLYPPYYYPDYAVSDAPAYGYVYTHGYPGFAGHGGYHHHGGHHH